jgi:alkylated DNA repair protein (DNA oxidative demethylase)
MLQKAPQLPGGPALNDESVWMMAEQIHPPPGFRFLPQYFDRKAQSALIDAVIDATRTAPFWRQCMPRTGQPMSVRGSNFGPLGWVTDKDQGYRYETRHPLNGQAWPSMPVALLELWRDVADYPDPPEACLINWYGADSKMGLHVDFDEEATDAAVVSVSLGDKARFRLGGPERKGRTMSMVVSSGDVVVLGGQSRRCYHGVDRIYPGTSTVLDPEHFPGGGRINLTLRRVTLPKAQL